MARAMATARATAIVTLRNRGGSGGSGKGEGKAKDNGDGEGDCGSVTPRRACCLGGVGGGARLVCGRGGRAEMSGLCQHQMKDFGVLDMYILIPT